LYRKESDKGKPRMNRREIDEVTQKTAIKRAEEE
jgi:hypothetical protein